MTYIKPAWIERMEQECEEANVQMEILKVRCDDYVEELNKPYTYEKYGRVHTRFEETVTKFGTFMIWVDNGININHKIVKVADI